VERCSNADVSVGAIRVDSYHDEGRPTQSTAAPSNASLIRSCACDAGAAVSTPFAPVHESSTQRAHSAARAGSYGGLRNHPSDSSKFRG
jgi:hypothetical protein